MDKRPDYYQIKATLLLLPCDDCDTCVLDFCKTLDDCVNTFNDYKNGKISIDDIV